MDTRQLVAFCAVVDRRSFSQAAERLGVTQPAVEPAGAGAREAARNPAARSLRSARRADRGRAAPLPRRAATARARGASRGRGRRRRRRTRSTGRSRSAPRPGRAGSCSPTCSASSRACIPACTSCSRSSTRRRSSSGSPPRARARRRRRGPAPSGRRLRAVLSRRGDPCLPAGPSGSRAGRSRSTSCAARADRDAGGCGCPAADRGRAAPRRHPAARPRRAARARAPGVGHERRARRLRRDVHLAAARSTPTSRPARLPRRELRGSSSGARSTSSARAAGPRRAPPGRSSSSHGAAPVIVRWSLAELPAVLAELGDRSVPSFVAGPRWDVARRCRGPRPMVRGSVRARRGAAGRRLAPCHRWRLGDRHGEGSLGHERPPAGLRPDHLLGRRVDDRLRRSHARPPDRRWRRQVLDSSRSSTTSGSPSTFRVAVTVGTALNALAHCAEALYGERSERELTSARSAGAELIARWLPRGGRLAARPRGERRPPPRRSCAPARRSPSPGWRLPTRSRRRSAAPSACRTAR